MIDWLDEFYSSPETRQLLEESFAPLFAEYGAAVAAIAGSEVGATPAVAPFIQAIASTYIGNYLSSSRAQLQELLSAPDPRAAIEGRLAEWAEKRPGKVAQEATVQTSNAVTQTVYKDAGVTRKRWNARGKSCPYCRRMNGKVVGIDRPFHKEGDSIEVPDSEISAKAKLNFTHEIGHPPQHQGCDCVIEADMASLSERDQLSNAERQQQVTYPGAPEVGVPPEGPDYVDAGGYGHKRGAEERLAQLRDLRSKRGLANNNMVPWELEAADGDFEAAIRGMRNNWLDSSANPASTMVQSVISEQFPGDAMVWSRGLAALEPSAAARATVSTAYRDTQRLLGDGPSTYKLYRGVKSEVTTRNALESWSTNRELAERFDGHAVLELTVRREDIFLDLRSESQFEREMVVIGSTTDTAAIRVLPGTGKPAQV